MTWYFTSYFQSPPATLCIQMILLAESNRLQQILATYGIRTQTPVEIEPLKVIYLNCCGEPLLEIPQKILWLFYS